MDSSLTDLLHLGVRFYEPGVGRFGQVDPALQGYNLYVYVENNPTVAIDPSGRATLWGWLRGELYVDDSCGTVVDFIKRVYEDDTAEKIRSVRINTWYAVDCVHCYSGTRLRGSWSNTKLPDGSKCIAKCTKKGAHPCEDWTIKLSCTRSWITRHAGDRGKFKPNDQEEFPYPSTTPSFPRGVRSVKCVWERS